jgi:ABC-2 type transport system ATP-binding protein
MAPIIRTLGLTKDYGRVRGLDHLSLDVDEGEVLGFLGPNGAGKTTTIRLLLDLIRPTSGQASIGEFNCHRQGIHARRLVGYLPGEMPIYPELSGARYLAYLASLRPDPPEPAILDRLLRRFDIAEAQLQRPLRDLSHGTRRKLGIVQALMNEPRVAILDEPTSGLDPLMIEAFAETLIDLKRAGRTTVFLSSHVLSEVERTCNRVAILRDGCLVAVQTLDSIRQSLPRRVTMRFAPGCAPPPPGVEGGRLIAHDADQWTLEIGGPMGPLLGLVAGAPLVDITVEKASLEDFVLGLYRSAS